MSAGGHKIRNQQGLHFITFAVVEWVDMFTRQQYREIIIESLEYCIKQKGVNLHAWVITSNHVHFIISAKDENKISDILRDFKKFTSIKILNSIKNTPSESRKEWMLSIFKAKGQENSRNSTYQFWRQDNRPIELVVNMMIDQRLNYIQQSGGSRYC